MLIPFFAFPLGTNLTRTSFVVAGVISSRVSNVATAQVSAAIIVTAILCPLVVTLLSKKENR